MVGSVQDARNGKNARTAMYQQYFQGYTEARIMKKDGKHFKLTRIYTAPYHEHDMTDRDWIKRKVTYVFMTLLALVGYVASALNGPVGAQAGAIHIIGSVTFAIVIFAVFAVVFYITCPRRMTIYEHEQSTKGLKIWSFRAGVAAICSFGAAIYSFVKGETFLSNMLFWCFGYAICSMLFFAIYYLENNTEYSEMENITKIPFYRNMDQF